MLDDFKSVGRLADSPSVVGAAGAVGIELLRWLESRRFPLQELRLYGSPRSAGRMLRFGGGDLPVRVLSENSFAGIDLALFSAGSTVCRHYTPVAAKAGAVVVDNSSAFRMEPGVPLVVPEVNAHTLANHRGIIANPNCVAAIMTVALAPVHGVWPIRRIIAATYQAASGAGSAAMEELRQSTAAYLRGDDYQPRLLPYPYAFNLFSHNAEVDQDSGYNGEEKQVIAETRRILGAEALPVSITCIRVPVLRAHAIALAVEFDTPIDPGEARQILEAAPGLRVVDDQAANHFPMPSEASGQDEVLVGRIRSDVGDPSGRSLALFVVGDQLLKGAALNAVQIAELLIGRSPVLSPGAVGG